jgi:hypothetical protein
MQAGKEGKEARQVGGQGMQARWSGVEMHATQARQTDTAGLTGEEAGQTGKV